MHSSSARAFVHGHGGPASAPAALVLLLVAAPLVSACGGGNGDSPSAPLANAYGDGSRMPDVVGEATWLDPEDLESTSCSSPPERSVHVTGITVVAIDRYDETNEGAIGNFYVQDTYAQRQLDEQDEPLHHLGMTVYAPSFSPPDLRLADGDVADVLGNFSEFLGPASGRFGYCRTLPEIGGTMSFRFEGGHVDPILIDLEELKSYETARPYIGTLVRVEDVATAGEPYESGGRYTVSFNVGAGVPATDVPKISNELFDLKGLGPALPHGTQIRAVTGVLTYFYGFKIAPRSLADFEMM